METHPVSHVLRRRRYTFRNQPEICNWNMAQLANALLAAELMPLVRAQLPASVPRQSKVSKVTMVLSLVGFA